MCLALVSAIVHRKCIAKTEAMKTATIPSLRVDPALRKAAEEALLEGESLSSFVEQSVRALIEQRMAQRAFVERGLAARAEAKDSGAYVSADTVLQQLASQLDRAKRARA